MKGILAILLLALCIACTDNVSTTDNPSEQANIFDAKAFYYPTEELLDGKVYEYVMLHEGEAFLSHYWHLQSEKDEEGNMFLIWKRYNQYFQQDQYIKEWVIADGVITQEYKMMVLDSATQQWNEYPNNVSQNVVFPFKPVLDSVMAYRFVCELKLPPDFLTSKLIRDRKFKETTSYSYQGEEVDAVVFNTIDLYDIENKDEGGFWNMTKQVVEIYAEGIGLVRQEERTEGQPGMEVTVLNKIYTIDEFNAQKNAYNASIEKK